MDRTRKLLMGVTASVLLSGVTNPLVAEPAVLTVNPQQQPDQKVTAASNIITELLSGVPEQNALTLNELLAKRPDLNRRYAERAIVDLLNRNLIRRTGDGTTYKPYRYYDRYRGSGLGG